MALAYLPALHGGMLWDDDAHVTRADLRSLHGLLRIWMEVGATQQYYPLLHSAFWAEHRIWGDSVFGYHAITLAFHATAAWLLMVALRRLAFPAATLAGFIFALHPVCVESVAWIAEQKNTLSAVLYLCAALAYLGFDDTRSRGRYVLASLLFIAALLTKSVTATLPAALLLVFWWRRGRLDARRDVLPLVPWFVTAALSGLLTAWIEARLIGAEGAPFGLSLEGRAILAGRVILFYAGSLLWPSRLMFIYPRWAIDPSSLGQYLYPASVLAGLAVLAAMSRRSRGPLVAGLFFIGTLAPVLGFVNVYPFLFSYVADHFQYLACLGVIVPLAWLIDRSVRKIGGPAYGRVLLLIAVPAVLGALTWRQCGDYRDSDTLNRATLARNPDAWLAHYNLAVSLGSQPGRLDESIAEYVATLKLDPDHWAAHNNLGSAYLAEPGHLNEAIAHFEEAIRLRPDFAEAHNNLAIALGKIGTRREEAEAHLRTAIRIRPDYDGALNNLGVLLSRNPRTIDEAIGDYKAALGIAPDNAEYHYNLANALAEVPGRLPDAVSEYREALRLRPDYVEAHSNLGAALARQPGFLPEAILHYRTAIALSPDNPRIHANLAHALAREPGRKAEAVEEYAIALRISPDDATLHLDFGLVLSDMPGRTADAIDELKSAIRLRPDYPEAHFLLGMVLRRDPKERDAAIAHLRRSLELRPDFDLARKELERLGAPGP